MTIVPDWDFNVISLVIVIITWRNLYFKLDFSSSLIALHAVEILRSNIYIGH